MIVIYVFGKKGRAGRLKSEKLVYRKCNLFAQAVTSEHIDLLVNQLPTQLLSSI